MSGLTSETPPAGTKCVDCMCCMAAIYAGKDPICWECDANKPCKGKQQAPTVDKMAKLDKIVGSTESRNAKAGIRVARLLKPRNYPANRRKPIVPIPPETNPPKEEMSEVERFPQTADEVADYEGQIDDGRGKPTSAGLSGQEASGARAGDHYDRVIQDLAMKKLEIGRIITFLRALQQGAR